MDKRFFSSAFAALALAFSPAIFSQVTFTAQDQTALAPDLFRAGYNSGYQPGWTDKTLADIAAGNPATGIGGLSARGVRQGLYFELFNIWGYATRVAEVQHYQNLGMTDLTGLIWGGANGGSEAAPPQAFRDQTMHCPTQQSDLFKNLYEPIWDAGANGTPVNENNFFATYLFKTVETYRDHVKFWEIWNEPGFDFTGDTGWRPAGDPAGNWWDADPDPCEYRLKAPIQHYVRMLRIAWEVVKTLDPDSFVCCGAPGYQSFLDAVCRNTDNPDAGKVTADFPHRGGAYFDALAYHSYPHFDGSTVLDPITKKLMRTSDRCADGVIDTRNYFQIVLSKWGFDGQTYPKKQFVITETNLPRRPFSHPSFFGSDLAQRNFMPKAIVNCIKNGIPQMHVFALAERKTMADASYEFDLMGLYRKIADLPAASIQANEEGISYATASKLLFGTHFHQPRTDVLAAPSGVRAEAFKTDEAGKFIYALWAKAETDSSEAAAATFLLPQNLEFESLERADWDFSQTGAKTAIDPKLPLALTATPIFLIGKDKASAALEPFSSKMKLDVFPNPAEKNSLVAASFFVEKEGSEAVVEAFDALGRRVFFEKIEGLKKGKNDVRLFEKTSLPSGQFLVSIVCEGERAARRLIVF